MRKLTTTICLAVAMLFVADIVTANSPDNAEPIYHEIKYPAGNGPFPVVIALHTSGGFNTVKNPDDCLPKPWDFSVSKPLYLSREMYMIHKGTGTPSVPITIPYLGDYEKLKTEPTLRLYEDPNKEFKSDIEKFLEGQDIEEIQEEENNE